MVLSPNMRRLIKWVGYPLFAIFSFFVFFYATFPDERLRTLIEEHVSASGEMKISIGEASLGPLIAVTLSDVRIELPPPRPPARFGRPAAASEEKKPARPRRVLISEAQVSLSLLALIGGGIGIDFELVGLGGELEGSYAASKGVGWSVDVEARGIKLHYIPQVADAVGLPVRGRLSGTVALIVPKNRWAGASGSIEVSCEGASIGDGQAKLKIPGNPMLAMGIKMPQVRIGKLAGKVTVEQGVATIEELSSHSADVQISLAGKINLRQPVGFSAINGYLKFKIAAELKRRDAKFELVESGLLNAKRPDGFYGMRLAGTLKNMRTFPSKIEPGAVGAPARRLRSLPRRR